MIKQILEGISAGYWQKINIELGRTEWNTREWVIRLNHLKRIAAHYWDNMRRN